MLKEIRRSEHFFMKLSRNHCDWAFTLVELFIVITIFAILAAVFLPDFARRRAYGPRINCTNNLKQIGLAFRTWALDHNENYPMNVSATNGGTLEYIPSGLASFHFQVLSNELSTPKILVCPADPKRIRATNFTGDFGNQRLSYFVGMDLVESNANGFLSGDRNITNALGTRTNVLTLTTNQLVGWTSQMHFMQGNICLTDGSVQGLSMTGLRVTLAATGLATNRLAMP